MFRTMRTHASKPAMGVTAPLFPLIGVYIGRFLPPERKPLLLHVTVETSTMPFEASAAEGGGE